MGDMSDLDLVAAAMAPTEPPNAGPSSQFPHPPASCPPSTSTSVAPNDSSHTLDTSRLSPQELATLAPLLETIRLDPASMASLERLLGDDAAVRANLEGDEGGDQEYEDLMRQMNAAGDVADELEGRLDALLDRLAGTEAEIAKGLTDETAKGNEQQEVDGGVNGTNGSGELDRDTRLPPTESKNG